MKLGDKDKNRTANVPGVAPFPPGSDGREQRNVAAVSARTAVAAAPAPGARRAGGRRGGARGGAGRGSGRTLGRRGQWEAGGEPGRASRGTGSMSAAQSWG